MSKDQFFPFPRELDPPLYDLYVRMLPIRGWAGVLSAAERRWLREKRAMGDTKNALRRGSAKLVKG